MDPKFINDLKSSLNVAPITFNLGSYVVDKNLKPSCLRPDRFVVNLYEKPSFSKKKLSISKNTLLKFKHDKRNSSVYHKMTRKNTDLVSKFDLLVMKLTSINNLRVARRKEQKWHNLLNLKNNEM